MVALLLGLSPAIIPQKRFRRSVGILYQLVEGSHVPQFET